MAGRNNYANNQNTGDRATITDAVSLFSDMSVGSNARSHSMPSTPAMPRNQLTGPKNSPPSKFVLHTQPRKSSFSDTMKKSTSRLVYTTSFGGKMNFNLGRDETSIGRKDDNQIVLSCAKISKYHACVQNKNGTYYIVDRNSSNGTRLNDELIPPNKPIPLSDQDVITIDTIELTFYDSSRPKQGSNKTEAGGSNLELVTILPSEQKYEETVTIRAEMQAEDVDFKKVDQVTDVNTLKEDYEKLRLAYELSKMSLTNDMTLLLAKSLELVFELIPVDRGVVLLVDQSTGILGTHYVKLREGKSNEGREILLSSTILRKVLYSRMCLITSDAYEDPMLGKAASVRYGQIRSVICVPLIAHNKVHGILHLDSRDRINSFSNKDLALVKSISNQTAIAIENSILIKEVENKARITEQLSRFLAPHVVDRMVNKTEIIKKGGREIVGTIVFVDIRGFTKLSEKSGPSEVVALLNDYFERLVDIVFKYEGVVDKYIGDALMAVFGTLEEEVDQEYRAVAACLEFKTAIKDMNAERAKSNKEPISIGIGVNTGELLAGFIGCSQRLEYTCIGDTVNTSSRICSMAQDDQVFMSEETYLKVRDRIRCRPVGHRQLKGKENQVMVYEAYGLI